MPFINKFHVGETVLVPVTESKKSERLLTPYIVDVHVFAGQIDAITVSRPTVDDAPRLLYRVRGTGDTYKEVWCREEQMFRTADEAYDYTKKLLKQAAKELACADVYIT